MIQPAPCPTVNVDMRPLDAGLLEAVLAIEHAVYPHPWQAQHFTDCLQAGYPAQVLCGGDAVLGYYVAMQGVDEVHLLNLAVAPTHQQHGWARLMLQHLALWARGLGAQWLWLEVRASNTRAIHLYKAFGFRYMGRRKAYYPLDGREREDAHVMSLALQDANASFLP
ncbi:MAG: ribosomal protein S18-alanine N-acetyltransferase [Rhodoferax sp.]